MSDFSYTTDNLGASYDALLHHVKTMGKETSPRGQLIREVRPLIVTLTNPRKCVTKRLGMSRAFMFVENLLLLAGEHDQEILQRYSSRGASMLNYYGAYGPRIRDQLLVAERTLKNDPDTRRAVLYVVRPSDPEYADELNMPCTLGYQFLLRNGKLELTTFMRSWDVVWGLSYDVPNAAQLQMCMAASLGVELGKITFVAGSGHIYEKHFGLEAGETDYELPCLAFPGQGLKAVRDAASTTLRKEKNFPGGGWLPFDHTAEVEIQAVFRRAAERRASNTPSQ